jgi:hypothetical protein
MRGVCLATIGEPCEGPTRTARSRASRECAKTPLNFWMTASEGSKKMGGMSWGRSLHPCWWVCSPALASG